MDKVTSEIERTTIQFPRILNLRRVNDLFSHISKELPARVYYGAELNVRFNEGISPEQEQYIKKRESFIGRVGGMITTFKPYVSTQYTLEQGGKSRRFFDTLRFMITPGYDLEELNPEEVELMDRTKRAAERYFSEHPGFSFK
jgi:hypothetical protein